ncbi:MAG: IS1380 family transposase [Deltaproteobacteria bacterium]|nr:IS1380 family transposase [Deltaproteobacteria bacterium]
MAQGILPFKYEVEGNGCGMTAFGGLPLYLDLAHVSGLSKSIEEHLGVRVGEQGWTDSEVVMSLVLLNLAGGECVDDLGIVEADEGFCRVLRGVQMHGLKRQARRELEGRWRKERRRSVPSPSAVFRYLRAFHDAEQEGLRRAGKAFIPVANEHLGGFPRVNRDFLAFVQRNSPQRTATLDMDATLVETSKSEALYCYKGFKSYQPLNTWWAEQGVIVHTEFRDGNVPAGYEQLRVLKEALRCLPDGVEQVRLRSDTAGYQHDLLKYCELAESERFGRIEFTIGCDVTEEFKRAVAGVEQLQWSPLKKMVQGREVETGTEWAEVCFVPNAIGHSKKGKGPEYRYVATRRLMDEQLILPGMDEDRQYPFPSMGMEGKKYKVFGYVTNMDWDGAALIPWLYKRCGNSEQAHGVMKEDLAGGKLPSKYFGENAAWWWIMILALNLNAAMKSLVLGRRWIPKRMKAIRFALINLPARVLERSRYLLVRLAKNHPAVGWLVEMRRKIANLAPMPSM